MPFSVAATTSIESLGPHASGPGKPTSKLWVGGRQGGSTMGQGRGQIDTHQHPSPISSLSFLTQFHVAMELLQVQLSNGLAWVFPGILVILIVWHCVKKMCFLGWGNFSWNNFGQPNPELLVYPEMQWYPCAPRRAGEGEGRTV